MRENDYSLFRLQNKIELNLLTALLGMSFEYAAVLSFKSHKNAGKLPAWYQYFFLIHLHFTHYIHGTFGSWVSLFGFKRYCKSLCFTKCFHFLNAVFVSFF